jgi:beta-mannosidase
MVWQDLMFANMDYPWSDEGFAQLVNREVEQTLGAIQSGPSLTVVCGNSEVDQQAAMLGLPASQWGRSGRDAWLEGMTRELAPRAVWLPTTPVGGTFPFQPNAGITHYYGVGAYRRRLDDARHSNVRFAAECLAFSNVPERALTAELLHGDERPHAYSPWKARVPRDAGADTDFEDVRDHYVARLFAIDATSLRSRDADTYLSLGRIATGEVMRRTFAEWRRPFSSCRGGLVWFGRDLWPGAGWGIIDAAGSPKSAYWYLKRVWAPVALLSVDEGMNGLWLHALNDTPAPIVAELRVALYRDGLRVGPAAGAEIQIPAHGSTAVHADALFAGFLDLTYAYRFGPPQHDAVASTIRDRSTGHVYASDCFYPGAIPFGSAGDLGLVARAELSNGVYSLLIRSERFAHAVTIDADGFLPDDNYFHLEPGDARRVALKAASPGTIPRGYVTALNCNARLIQIEEAVHAG